MARKRLIVRKDGVVTKHAISKRNLVNYRVIGEVKSKGRWVKAYQKRGEGKIATSKKYKMRPLKEVTQGPMTGMQLRENLVEVTGLVSVTYDKKRYFHAEMLFNWYGKAGFDEDKLLDNAVEVLIDVLPEIERIPFELAGDTELYPDFNRRGIEQTRLYDGDRENEMDFEVFIPTAGVGRVLTSGSARVEA